MKANANFNSALFRKFDQSTAAITSNIMIGHPIKEPGNYRGIVLKERQEIGYFTLTCQDSVTEMQADIDLYQFDNRFKTQCECDDNKAERYTYKVRPGGFAFFYSSFGEGGYQVVLNHQVNDQVITYTTARLERGDIVVLLFMRPGDYEVTGSNGQVCAIALDTPDSVEEYQKLISEAVTISLNDVEFSVKELRLVPGQGLVVNLETEGALNIRLIRAREITDALKGKKRTWENPKYKNP